MRSFSISNRSYKYKTERPEDLLVLDIVDSGANYPLFIRRSGYKVMVFERDHKNTLISEKELEEYKELVLEHERIERSFDENCS